MHRLRENQTGLYICIGLGKTRQGYMYASASGTKKSPAGINQTGQGVDSYACQNRPDSGQKSAKVTGFLGALFIPLGFSCLWDKSSFKARFVTA